jgi:hypothetical protein
MADGWIVRVFILADATPNARMSTCGAGWPEAHSGPGQSRSVPPTYSAPGLTTGVVVLEQTSSVARGRLLDAVRVDRRARQAESLSVRRDTCGDIPHVVPEPEVQSVGDETDGLRPTE